MKRVFLVTTLVILTTIPQILAQTDTSTENGTEIFLIDAYVTNDQPYKFVISFFTTEKFKSKVVISDKYKFDISKDFEEDHKGEIELKGIKFDSTSVHFRIIAIDHNGIEHASDNYELILPFKIDPILGGGPGIFQVCCFGGIIFGIPSPTYITNNGESYFSLTKEIPLISYYAGGYNYPSGYFSLEYAYVFNAESEHYLRAGYKHIFQLPVVEYVSPGLGLFSDMKGHNGISTELSLGIVRIYNVFTLFTRYRYNIQPGGDKIKFHEFSIGLYSNFFSFNF